MTKKRMAGTASKAGNAAETKKQRKRKKLHEYTAENDLKYRGPLNYQAFQILGWLCMVCTVPVVMINFGGEIHPDIAERLGGPGNVLSYIAALSLPFLLMSNFSRILANTEGFKRQFLRNGGAALAIFAGTVFVGSRYFVGTAQQIFVQKDEVLPLLTSAFRKYNREGFVAFNLFIDLFLCTLTMYFLNARPKRFFTGKKTIILRLFVLLPIAYEVICLILKIRSARGLVRLPLWSFPLLTVKPVMTFVFFVFAALLVRFREYRYCRNGRTHEEYLEFMKTNRNAFHLSVRFSLSMVFFAAVDMILFFTMIFSHMGQVVSEGAAEMNAAQELSRGIQSVEAIGIGGAMTLVMIAPLMLLYSYNTVPKRKIISMLVPAAAIVLMILAALETFHCEAGIYMAGREIDMEEVGLLVREYIGK